MPKTEIPIVDIAELGVENEDGKADQSTWNRVAKELDSAFSTVGFVYLKNHGIDEQIIDKFLRISRDFFNLLDEVKEKYPRNLETFEGYIGRKSQKWKNNDLGKIREAYDFTRLENGMYPDAEVPELRRVAADLGPQLTKLAMRILKCLAIALGLEEDFFTSRHKYIFHGADKSGTSMRSMYYPPLKDYTIEPGDVRIRAHTDFGTMTILIQDSIGGLEVLSGSEWIAATPIPGTVLINLGDLLQFWTSGRYVATVHRVLVPEDEVRQNKCRQSIPFFVYPDKGVMISPLDGSGKYEPVDALTYLRSALAKHHTSDY